MKTTTVFRSGNSLAVRLPREFALPLGRVYIEQRKGEVVLRSVEHDWPANLRTMFKVSAGADDWNRPEDPPAENRNLEW